MKIDLNSLSKETKRPLHQQLAELMRGAIRAGVYRPGDQIESERTLMKHSRLSQPTVTRALKDLAKEGWVVRRTGSGTFVNATPIPKRHQLRKVGLFYYDTRTPYFERLLNGVQSALSSQGIELTVMPAGMSYEHEDRVVAELEHRGIDALIAAPFGGDLLQRELMRLIREGIPVVSVGVHLPQISCDTVGFDQVMAGQHIARHLADLGHRNLAFVCPEFLYPDTSSLDTIEGVREICHSYGMSLPEERIAYLPTIFNEETDMGPRKQLLDLFDQTQDHKPTALICSTDGLAHFAYMLLSKAGMRVPHDVSVTGGGDLPMASQLDPMLTTVSWPLERMGREAVRLLLDRHSHPDRRPIQRVLDTQLIIRRSTSMANSL